MLKEKQITLELSQLHLIHVNLLVPKHKLVAWAKTFCLGTICIPKLYVCLGKNVGYAPYKKFLNLYLRDLNFLERIFQTSHTRFLRCRSNFSFCFTNFLKKKKSGS